MSKKMFTFALGNRCVAPGSYRHRIYDIRFLQVVIKLGRFKNQATVQLGNHRPRYVGDDPGCMLEGFCRDRMTTLGELTFFYVS